MLSVSRNASWKTPTLASMRNVLLLASIVNILIAVTSIEQVCLDACPVVFASRSPAVTSPIIGISHLEPGPATVSTA